MEVDFNPETGKENSPNDWECKSENNLCLIITNLIRRIANEDE